MTIGENIKKYRNFRNFTRKQLAQELEVSESTISRYENNKREPNMETIRKISSILGIPVTFLMDDNSLNSYMSNKLKNVSFSDIKKEVDSKFPTLEPMIQLLSNPQIEMFFNFTYNELASRGYEDLLFIAIEKAIKDTLQDIKAHEDNGDLFDGVCSWITKDSPLYEQVKKITEKNK